MFARGSQLNTKYKKYEFCKSVGCWELEKQDGVEFCRAGDEECSYTAKEFHHWLNRNGFEIVKKTEEV